MNVIKKLHEQTNMPYKQMAEEINIKIEKYTNNKKEELQVRTLICYANGAFLPKREIIINAMADYFNTTSVELIRHLKKHLKAKQEVA